MLTISILAAIAAGIAGLGGAAATGDQTDPVILAVAPTPATAPTTQPGARAFTSMPTTQSQGSQISFLLTRSLPKDLREAHLLARTDLTPRDRQLVGFHAILRDSQKSIEQIVNQKKEFDRMPTDQQARYREKAVLIEKVLNSLSDSERSQLLSLNPKERAKRIMELAAQIKARQLREGSNPAPTTPK
ncbi:MAG: hypothetical protein PHU85_06135 [Phycisphaerae bacterium]|nr:hypothetical protein [Phycisphaerae bacterium]